MTSGITAWPCLLQSAASAASSRSTITTREPAANIASALANPMPDAAPVTTATLPSNSLPIVFLLVATSSVQPRSPPPRHRARRESAHDVIADEVELPLPQE